MLDECLKNFFHCTIFQHFLELYVCISPLFKICIRKLRYYWPDRTARLNIISRVDYCVVAIYQIPAKKYIIELYVINRFFCYSTYIKRVMMINFRNQNKRNFWTKEINNGLKNCNINGNIFSHLRLKIFLHMASNFDLKNIYFP